MDPIQAAIPRDTKNGIDSVTRYIAINTTAGIKKRNFIATVVATTDLGDGRTLSNLVDAI